MIRPQRHDRPVPGSSSGFTLLEILAVVAIFALVAAVAMPNMSRLQIRRLDDTAELLIARIEIARQRAIVTGVPHRLTLDIDGGAYWVEWQGAAAVDDGFETQDTRPVGTGSLLDLTAPRDPAREFAPLPNLTGRTVTLSDSIIISGVETTGGWVDRGEGYVYFERDGYADPTTIVLEHESGHLVRLEILPLSSLVRVEHEAI